MIYDVAIIGGGPVGLAAAFSCGLEGLDCVIIDANSVLGGQCSAKYADKYIYDIPGCLKIKAKDLVGQLMLQVEQFNPRVILNDIVISANKSQEDIFEIVTKNGVLIKAKCVVLALGAGIFSSVKLELANETELMRSNIIYDFSNVEKYRDKIVVVLGGGDTALDYAFELSQCASKVYLIHRKCVFKGSAHTLQLLEQSENVAIYRDMFLLSVYEEEHAMKLKFDNGFEVCCDYIFPCYGVVTNLSFLESWNLKLVKNKIKVDENFETSSAGIYAIGDCIWRANRRNLLVVGFAEAMNLGVVLSVDFCSKSLIL